MEMVDMVDEAMCINIHENFVGFQFLATFFLKLICMLEFAQDSRGYIFHAYDSINNDITSEHDHVIF